MSEQGRGGLPAPNYTQVPNHLFDIMEDMSHAELLVTLAIVRQTFGWHRAKARLTQARIGRMCGLSLPSVRKGIQEGIDRGLIEQIEEGRRANGTAIYSYGLVVFQEQEEKQEQEQEQEETGKTFTHDRKKFLPSTGKSFSHIKESSKESKEKEKGFSNGAEAPRPKSPHKAIIQAYEDQVTGRGLIANLSKCPDVLKALDELGATPEEVAEATAFALDQLGWTKGAFYFQRVPNAIKSYRARRKKKAPDLPTEEEIAAYVEAARKRSGGYVSA